MVLMAAAHFSVTFCNSPRFVELGASINLPILTVIGTDRGRGEPDRKIFSVPHKLTGNRGACAWAAIVAAPSFGLVIRASGVRVPCKKIPVAQPSCK